MTIGRAFAFAAVLAFGVFYAKGQAPTTEPEASLYRVSECHASFTYPTYTNTHNWKLSDKTVYMEDFKYNYTLCNGIKLSAGVVIDYNTDDRYKCTLSPTTFTTAEKLNLNCSPLTQGQMAGISDDWAFGFRLSLYPSNVNYENEFFIAVAPEDPNPTTTTAPATTTTLTSSGQVARKRRALGQTVMPAKQCSAGYELCEEKGRFTSSYKCIDTSANLYSCGGCPGSATVQDCSEIAGIADVTCEGGACIIRECDRHHELSLDGESCVPSAQSWRR